eukprot:1112598-Lingulodinium_polyedra.AAC.1
MAAAKVGAPRKGRPAGQSRAVAAGVAARGSQREELNFERDLLQIPKGHRDVIGWDEVGPEGRAN